MLRKYENMKIVEKNDRKEIILKLKDKVDENNFDYYWKGFESFPLALYNSNEVYLINYKALPKGYYVDGKVAVGKWDERFKGNTAVNLDGQYMAIWNMDTLDEMIDLDKLYSEVVHEMFHACQLKNGDKRFGDEVMYLTYKFTGEFLDLRMKERECLLKALFETDEAKKKELISDFISIRECRRSLIGERINYEYGVESIEGTATYVEYKAFQKETKLPEKYIAAGYGKRLIENNDLKDFRSSCYFSGMFIALIMDSFCGNWQASYDKSGMYLYDYFKTQMEWTPKEFTPQVNAYISYILRNYDNLARKEITDFYINSGYDIILDGRFSITGFDPMNIVSLDNRLLHKNFVMLNNKYLIKEKTVTTYGENNVLTATSVEFFVKAAPLMIEGGIYIEGVGELKGKVVETTKGYIVKFKQPFVNY